MSSWRRDRADTAADQAGSLRNVGYMSDRETVAPFGSELTPRESECIDAYREHKSYAAAADALGISPFTLREHLANARSRRGVRWTWELFGDHRAA